MTYRAVGVLALALASGASAGNLPGSDSGRLLAQATPGAGLERASQDAVGPLTLDALVVDGKGRPVTDLTASEFTVAVDGNLRRVLAARHVYRGPGAEAAAGQAARGGGAAASTPLAEPSRLVLLVIDEASFVPGGEKSAGSAVSHLIDRLGPADRVALVTLPTLQGPLRFSADRGPVRAAIDRIVGRARLEDLPGSLANSLPQASTGDPKTERSKGRATEKPRQMPGQGGDASAWPEESREYALDALTRLLGGLRSVPGPKTLVFGSAGLSGVQVGSRAAGVTRGAIDAATAEAVAARTVIDVLGLPGSPWTAAAWNELEQLSRGTGGELVRPARKLNQGVDRLALSLSGSYQLEVEASAADRDGQPHAIRITASRPGVDVRAARAWTMRADPPFVSPRPAVARARPEDSGASSGGRTKTGAPDSASRRDPDLDRLMDRALKYLDGYVNDFSNVVTEEDYVQTLTASRGVYGPSTTRRRLRSDFLLATGPDGTRWIPFRDVFEVDGQPVRDRQDRLQKLFLDAPAKAMDSAARIAEEGARYNLGSATRTVNRPTTVLTFLLPSTVRGFAFRRGREETVEGVRTLRVDYEETGRPTVIRGTGDRDVPASGSLWIDPATGCIVKTLVRATHEGFSARDHGLTMEMTVVFRMSETLHLYVPAGMIERYRSPQETIEARATYSNFRSFQVATHEQIKVSK